MYSHNQFVPLPGYSGGRVEFVNNAGLIVRHVDAHDRGTYSVNMDVRDVHGSLVALNRSAEVIINGWEFPRFMRLCVFVFCFSFFLSFFLFFLSSFLPSLLASFLSFFLSFFLSVFLNLLTCMFARWVGGCMVGWLAGWLAGCLVGMVWWLSSWLGDDWLIGWSLACFLPCLLCCCGFLLYFYSHCVCFGMAICLPFCFFACAIYVSCLLFFSPLVGFLFVCAFCSYVIIAPMLNNLFMYPVCLCLTTLY